MCFHIKLIANYKNFAIIIELNFQFMPFVCTIYCCQLFSQAESRFLISCFLFPYLRKVIVNLYTTVKTWTSRFCSQQQALTTNMKLSHKSRNLTTLKLTKGKLHDNNGLLQVILSVCHEGLLTTWWTVHTSLKISDLTSQHQNSVNGSLLEQNLKSKPSLILLEN